MMLKHAITWLVVLLLSILLLPGMLDTKTYLNTIKEDQNKLASEIGQQSADIIIKTTDHIYNTLFEDSGFHPWVSEHYIHSLNQDNELFGQNKMDKVTQGLSKYLGTFFISMYETTYRLTQVGYWAVFIFPFMIAAAFDGLMTRKVRILSFHYSSPTRYNALWHFMIILFSGTMLYSNMPFSMPALAFPVIVFAASMGLRSLLANMQRSA
jgi:hypothetical protein